MRTQFSRTDRWALVLTITLAYLFMAAAVVVVVFPSLRVPEALSWGLLGAVELFLLLRAYLAFRVRSTIEGVTFVGIFLLVAVAVWWPGAG